MAMMKQAEAEQLIFIAWERWLEEHPEITKPQARRLEHSPNEKARADHLLPVYLPYRRLSKIDRPPRPEL